MVKITGPSPGQPTEGPGDTPDVERSGGKAFAGALEKTEATTAPPPPARSGGPVNPLVGNIGERLESGEITPKEAVDEVVGRVLDQQLGAGASSQVRSQVESHLMDQLENDPRLKRMVDSLT
jgi:hypothetical protein